MIDEAAEIIRVALTSYIFTWKSADRHDEFFFLFSFCYELISDTTTIIAPVVTLNNLPSSLSIFRNGSSRT